MRTYQFWSPRDPASSAISEPAKPGFSPLGSTIDPRSAAPQVAIGRAPALPAQLGRPFSAIDAESLVSADQTLFRTGAWPLPAHDSRGCVATACRPTGLGTPNTGVRRTPCRAPSVGICTGRGPGKTPASPLEAGAFGLQSAAVSPNRWGVLAVLRSLIHLLMCSLDQTYREESLEVRSTAQYDPPSGGRSSRQNTAPNSRTQNTTQEVFHVQP